MTFAETFALISPAYETFRAYFPRPIAPFPDLSRLFPPVQLVFKIPIKATFALISPGLLGRFPTTFRGYFPLSSCFKIPIGAFASPDPSPFPTFRGYFPLSSWSSNPG